MTHAVPTPGTSWPVGQAEPVPHGSVDLDAEQAARERIFDRQAARQLSYVQPAWLWWAEHNCPVTVQDVSAVGVRILLSLSPGSPAPPTPTPGDATRIFFPVNGTTVKAAARLQWKERTSTHVEMGLEFVDLVQEHADLLRELLVAAD